MNPRLAGLNGQQIARRFFLLERELPVAVKDLKYRH